MEFLTVYNLGPDFVTAISPAYGTARIYGLYAQLDVWSTHIFLVYDDEGQVRVEMYGMENLSKGVPPEISYETVDDALCCGADDAHTYRTVEAAMEEVCCLGNEQPEPYPGTFDLDTGEFH